MTLPRSVNEAGTQRSFTVTGQIVDLVHRRIFPGEIVVVNGKIASITQIAEASGNFILPGFIDAHVHVESSMLTPARFAELAVRHGTVATVSDPHEIANVCGREGVLWMVRNGATVPFKFHFGVPSCVPATSGGLETSGAIIDSQVVAELLTHPELTYLAEMMNFPGVLGSDAEVIAKLRAAVGSNKPIDGHAPGLRGESAGRYIAAGPSTDHECFTLEEALDKLGQGLKYVLIREGSAARNFEALQSLLRTHPQQVMFCTDDAHPDMLFRGHINKLVARAIRDGYDVYDVLNAACVNPVKHFGLDVGVLQVGDSADLVVVNDLVGFEVLATYVNGQKVAENGRALFTAQPFERINNFVAPTITLDQLQLPRLGENLRAIRVLDGQLISEELLVAAQGAGSWIAADTTRDLLKVVVVNRYGSGDRPPAVAMVNGFGLRRGAIASSVGHDCHNIVAVGANDADLLAAIRLVIGARGGIALASGRTRQLLPLPIGGLMSDEDGQTVATEYATIDAMAKNLLGSTLGAPFMALAFLPLLVIPRLKISDLGLFDSRRWQFVPVSF